MSWRTILINRLLFPLMCGLILFAIERHFGGADLSHHPVQTGAPVATGVGVAAASKPSHGIALLAKHLTAMLVAFKTPLIIAGLTILMLWAFLMMFVMCVAVLLV